MSSLLDYHQVSTMLARRKRTLAFSHSPTHPHMMSYAGAGTARGEPGVAAPNIETGKVDNPCTIETKSRNRETGRKKEENKTS